MSIATLRSPSSSISSSSEYQHHVPSPVPTPYQRSTRKEEGPRKRKRDDTEDYLMKKLEALDENDEDEDSLFCRSLVPTLQRLTPRQNKLAKIKIQQLLFDIEFEASS